MLGKQGDGFEVFNKRAQRLGAPVEPALGEAGPNVKRSAEIAVMKVLFDCKHRSCSPVHDDSFSFNADSTPPLPIEPTSDLEPDNVRPVSARSKRCGRYSFSTGCLGSQGWGLLRNRFGETLGGSGCEPISQLRSRRLGRSTVSVRTAPTSLGPRTEIGSSSWPVADPLDPIGRCIWPCQRSMLWPDHPCIGSSPPTSPKRSHGLACCLDSQVSNGSVGVRGEAREGTRQQMVRSRVVYRK